MGTPHTLLNAQAEKLELYPGRDSTVGWNYFSGVNEKPGMHSKGTNSSA